MIYWTLFWEFFKSGLFAFGGVYGTIPMYRGIVLSQNWMTDQAFSNVIAISESTPGAIMINIATYVGSQQGGWWGGVVASIGVVLPSFLIILVVAKYFMHIFEHPKLQGSVKGIKQCIAGIILATGAYMGVQACFIFNAQTVALDPIALLILAILLGLKFGYQKYANKNFSSILLIVVSAILGVLLY